MTALVVEDDLIFSQVIEVMLCDFFPGIHLTFAHTLEEAREKAVSSDLVVLDLGLPDSAGGIDTVMEVNAAAPHVPIVILTGSDDQAVVRQSVRYGARDYFKKCDFTIAEFRQSVERIVSDMGLRKRISESREAIERSMNRMAERARQGS